MKDFRDWKILCGLILVGTLTLETYGFAEDVAPTEPATAANPLEGIVPIPAFYYTPETAVAAGGVLIYYWRDRHDDPDTKPSQIKPIVIGTTKKQLITSLLISKRRDNGREHLSVFLRYRRYPDKIWALGPRSEATSEEDYSCNIQFAEALWEHAIGKDWMFGPLATLGSYKVTERNELGMLTGSDIVGGKGSKTYSAGVQLAQDTRNNLFSPDKGNLIVLRSSRFEHIGESLSPYNETSIDMRTYIPVVKDHALALRVFAQWQNGDVPFRELASLGGPDRMRGYYEGRFRDKSAAIAEGEYRFPLGNNFRGALFGSVGNVGRDLGAMNKSPLKQSYGGGVRYVVDPAEKIAIRVDYGKTSESEGFYIQLNEAF
jgi:outer membrane protein assembly factor BamA